MRKIICVLSIPLLMISCGEVKVTTTDNLKVDKQEESNGKKVYTVDEIMKMGSDGINNTYTVKGFHCGMLGSTKSEFKTLYLHQKKSNNPSLEVELNKEVEEKLKDTKYGSEITVSIKLVELTDFDTKMKATDCEVVSMK